MTIKIAIQNATELLRKSKNIDTYKIDAVVLLYNSLDVDKSFIYSHDDYEIPETKLKIFNKYIQRRTNNEPISYIIKKKEFYALDFYIDQNVLIPRPETEHIVEYIINNAPLSCSLLDVCTGSGCIPTAVKYHRNDISIEFSDISRKAIDIAIGNYKKITNESPCYYISDIFHNIPTQNKYNIICSNPPYIKSSMINTLSKDVKNYEPIIALDGGKDGLKYYFEIIEKAPKYLLDNGKLIFEIDEYVSKDIINKIKHDKRISHYNIIKDYANIDRVLIVSYK